jgi:hypothetical protein
MYSNVAVGAILVTWVGKTVARRYRQNTGVLPAKIIGAIVTRKTQGEYNWAPQ